MNPFVAHLEGLVDFGGQVGVWGIVGEKREKTKNKKKKMNTKKPTEQVIMRWDRDHRK
jgi:hypothetical protein